MAYQENIFMLSRQQINSLVVLTHLLYLDQTAHYGSVEIIKQNNTHCLEVGIQTGKFQLTVVSAIHTNQEVNIATAYTPPDIVEKKKQ